MGSSKGGQADQSGMYQAMAAAQAADKAYQLGEQQLQWTQQVWNQEQPLMDASEKQQMALAAQQQKSLEQMTAEAQSQWGTYESTYLPLEQKFAGEAQSWASPQNLALTRGQAMGNVAEQGQAGLNTAAETLRSYGINPSSPRYASLYTSAQPMLGAAQAAAGTSASQNLKMQQMGLESGAINTGRGMVNTTGSLTTAGTGAGQAGAGAASGAANTANTNLSTGSTAMTAPSQWFNAGANNMNSYVNAVNGYNQSQAQFNEAGASEMSGFGSALGSVLGMGFMGKFARGGAVGYDDGGVVDGGVQGSDPQLTPDQGGGETGIPGAPLPPAQLPADATPGGGVPSHASPSGGAATDDVPAQLTAGEFVIPKDVAMWKGHEYFAKQLDQARAAQQKFSQRDDVGGEPTGAIPQMPAFVSRPSNMGMTRGAIPGLPA